eukprot:1608124-Pleurochrysis_carterae.AAC.1
MLLGGLTKPNEPAQSAQEYDAAQLKSLKSSYQVVAKRPHEYLSVPCGLSKASRELVYCCCSHESAKSAASTLPCLA